MSENLLEEIQELIRSMLKNGVSKEEIKAIIEKALSEDENQSLNK
jgi:DNA-binding transcriptional regulator YhcF (GntR family)